MDCKEQLKAWQLIRQLLNHAEIHSNKFSLVKSLNNHLEYKAFPFLQVCLKHPTWGTTRTGILLVLTLSSLTELIFNTQAQILGLQLSKDSL